MVTCAIFVCFLVVVSALVASAVTRFSQSAHAQAIVVDPGHGGNDPGGTGNGMEEKDIVLDTSLRFLELLRGSGAQGGRNWTAEITRDTDVFIPLASRASYANNLGADRFVSIHANAFADPQANGTETFSAGAPTTSSEMRDLIQEEMVAEWGLTDRGGKTANFTVLTDTSMPASLSELGFVTNPGDAVLLASDDARQRAAQAHLRALERHYGGVPEPEPEPSNGSILVQVILNSEPLEAIEIQLDGVDVGVTDVNGTLLLEELAAATYVVRATLPGYAPFELSTTVRDGETARADFGLEEEDVPPANADAGCGCSQVDEPTLPLSLALVGLLLLLRRRRSANQSLVVNR
jgi:MYXO-CTERM domain-containing protein